MSYNLLQNSSSSTAQSSTMAALKKMWQLVRHERSTIFLALGAITINSLISLAGPFLMGYAIDTYIPAGNYSGLLTFAAIMAMLYLVAYISNYFQMQLMGGVGQRMLYRLRSDVVKKLQELPVDFFNQNKTGDLISRISNDTDKVNQFFSQSLMQFIGSMVGMVGAGIFLLSIHFTLGLMALLPALLVWVFTRIISPAVKQRNGASLKSTGELSAEVQESLANFKVIIAFNRRDYFRRKFEEVNRHNYKTAVKAGVLNQLLLPVYSLASHLGQLIVMAMGIFLIIQGSFTIGVLISFLAYINSFYSPLRSIAGLWSGFQLAMAAWDRIAGVLQLESNLVVRKANSCSAHNEGYLTFKNVSFTYPGGKEVLHHVGFSLQRGKTYAFVGPTGGGKTTTASLIARLYDATKGLVLLDGKDIRCYTPQERTAKIGFILQEPFLFDGTLRDNILYGNEAMASLSLERLTAEIESMGLHHLLHRFDDGLNTPISHNGEGISLGQKQLVAFMRTVLRRPELLILDEATANIDTVTEQLLDDILRQLPPETTRVIIAHRLNTIENADEIFFVNAGKVIRAGSLDDAVEMLLHGKRES